MTRVAQTILRELVTQGIQIRADDGDLALKPAHLVTVEMIDRIRPHKPALLALLLVESLPPLPTPDDWCRGIGITPEAVGFERWQYGGRPHTLLPRLRRIWLDTYTTSMRIMPEPQAWAEAWRAIGTTDGARNSAAEENH